MTSVTHFILQFNNCKNSIRLKECRKARLHYKPRSIPAARPRSRSDLKHAKAVLAARIIATLDERGLSVRKAAALTGFAAADFSRIRNADLERFTLDRLMKMLAALDRDLQITVHVDSRHRDESAMVT